MPPDVMGREDATEVLRAFVVDQGLSIAFMRAFDEPDMWGLLLVDIARHAARAYARESDLYRGRGADAHRHNVRRRNRAADRYWQYHAAVATRSLTMPINILMPALSPTMEKGNLAKWLKKEGDKVKSGDVIAEIETDKATMEVEAVDEGTIAKIVVPEGTQDVPVNDVIAVLAGDGEDVKAAGARRSSPRLKRSLKQSLRPKPRQRPKPKPKRRKRKRRLRSPRRLRHSSACARSGKGAGAANQRPCPHFLFAARAASRQGSQYRARAHQRLRPARPRHRARRRGGQIRQGAEGSGCRARRRRAEHRAVDVGQADPRALRGRFVRSHPA